MLRWPGRLTETQRVLLADKVLDLANIAAGGMIFGQFLADGPFSVSLAVWGLAWWLLLVANAMRLFRGPKP